jgi:hypothetical protein
MADNAEIEGLEHFHYLFSHLPRIQTFEEEMKTFVDPPTPSAPKLLKEDFESTITQRHDLFHDWRNNEDGMFVFCLKRFNILIAVAFIDETMSGLDSVKISNKRLHSSLEVKNAKSHFLAEKIKKAKADSRLIYEYKRICEKAANALAIKMSKLADAIAENSAQLTEDARTGTRQVHKECVQLEHGLVNVLESDCESEN